MTAPSAFQRFLDSTVLDFDRWHDGEGYDVSALAEMSAEERLKAGELMLGRDMTWREIEVLEALDQSVGWQAIERALEEGDDADVRLATAAALHRRQRLRQPLEEILAREIRRLRTIPGGSTRALLMAAEYPSAPVKEALFAASSRKSEIALHCAALLCYLSGKAREPFDWELRPFFLRFGPDNEEEDRQAALRELGAILQGSTR
jgi:hypothetical protein